MKSDESSYKEFIEYNFGFNIGSIWDYVCDDFQCFSYEERIEEFSNILEKAMKSGILKLANSGEFLEGSIDDQVKKFKESFPDKEEDLFEFFFGLDVDGNIWAPGGGVWICSDGDEIWT
ncbi:DUF596 domain-containing protein [Zymobacter sp. IVIA_5232.4 C2]|uniref:DUF596 domain-containing protein n=1 Tax=Zymobacter sp. IVIA_5232.4 C2 TaxID=3394855 RepID=UPI0039C3ADB8